ncbi:porin [Bradyrhizobium diversitatis]|uniref:Porin n=1 Tax=Bradyrhizobium diversitatis TaxID=2755406 RepID=A0ABS0PFH7_9BRAD|nr:porin [Bradyrhizobium diversitatis]MBH5391869.1 porin [Bradyrhizobium diversitatis]
MKLTQTLMLGSAAMFAGAGAQAADLPVKAKAVEYVKICTLYGAGFYYVPGADTCIKLGGYLRADLTGHAADFTAYHSGTNAANNRLSNYYYARSRFDFNIDTRTATEYGVLRTYADVVFNWTSGSYNGAGAGLTGGATTYSTSGAPGAVADGNLFAGGLGVYTVFLQFAGFTMGHAISQFSTPWVNYPANSFDGLPGGGGTVVGVNQFTYTADFGQGVTLSLSAQDPVQNYQSNLWNVSAISGTGIVGGAYGANDFGGTRAPDLVAMLRVDQAWGLFQASFAAHNNHAGYYGQYETSGSPADKWGGAGLLALSIKNLPTGPGDTINIQGVYTEGATRYNFQEITNSTYSMFGGTGLAGAYGSIGFAGLSDAVFVAGSGLELTTSYGMNAGYTHNWNPSWNTSLYGAYGAVRYNGTAKGYICGSAAMAALLTAGSTCNPDFDLWVIGTRTGWTPVKGLTFSADLNYSQLNQKYAGSINYPGSTTAAKPPAIYEIKDQGTVSLLLRAQRNF